MLVELGYRKLRRMNRSDAFFPTDQLRLTTHWTEVRSYKRQMTLESESSKTQITHPTKETKRNLFYFSRHRTRIKTINGVVGFLLGLTGGILRLAWKRESAGGQDVGSER
jgi:hypothetical protein